jgi:hypothetical protein
VPKKEEGLGGSPAAKRPRAFEAELEGIMMKNNRMKEERI